MATVAVDEGDVGAAVTVFLAARCLTSRLVNYLLPAMAERFADVVHARYAKVAAAVPGVVRAAFFDHPYAGFYRWEEMTGAVGNSLLFDEAVLDFPSVRRHGLGPTLAAVTGPARRAVRSVRPSSRTMPNGCTRPSSAR